MMLSASADPTRGLVASRIALAAANQVVAPCSKLAFAQW